MLKITVLGLISAVLAGGLLAFKFVAYDLEDESDVGDIHDVMVCIEIIN